MFSRKIHLSWKLAMLVVGLLLALSPATALAQSYGILTEVNESPPAHAAPGGPTMPGTFPPGIGGRLAEATLVGDVTAVGTLAPLNGEAEVHAQSRVPVVLVGSQPALGSGSLSGVFKIDNDSNGAVVGKIKGTLDFTPTHGTAPWLGLCGGPCPFAQTMGTFSTLGKTGVSAQFSGFALIPFDLCAPNGCWFYFDPTGLLGGGLQPLNPATDFSKQFRTPLAKFVFFLF